MTHLDIIFLHNDRPEFTRASDAALQANTNGSRVQVIHHVKGESSPVAAMNKWLDVQLLSRGAPDLFAKIDNDVIVPPGWVEAAVDVMDRYPELSILGLEPWQSRTPAPWAKDKPVSTPEKNWIGGAGYVRVECVGGVFVARRSAFARSRPVPRDTYGGFTDWQIEHSEIVKGWIVPSIKLFLLDRLPVEPWRSLSDGYIARGVQRPWTNYDPNMSSLWDWWKP